VWAVVWVLLWFWLWRPNGFGRRCIPGLASVWVKQVVKPVLSIPPCAAPSDRATICPGSAHLAYRSLQCLNCSSTCLLVHLRAHRPLTYHLDQFRRRLLG